MLVTGESEEESRDSDTRSGVSELEMRMIQDWEESDLDMITVAEKVDPKADPLEEETKAIEGVLKGDEDSPNLKTSIQIGPTRISIGAQRSIFESLAFDTDEEVTTGEEDLEDETRDLKRQRTQEGMKKKRARRGLIITDGNNGWKMAPKQEQEDAKTEPENLREKE